MSSEKEKFERKQNRTKKIMGFIVAPILFMIAGLLALGIFDFEEEKPSAVEILSTLDLHCYNVNWFGTHGFQTVYRETVEDIAYTLDEYDIDFKSKEFFTIQEVIDHFILVCPHLDSRLQIPEFYNPMIGTNAIDKCLQVKLGLVGAEIPMQNAEEYCLQFKQ